MLSGALTACTQAPQKPAAEDDGPNRLGKAISEYGERSPHEKLKRLKPDVKNPQIGATRTPLAETHGIITPASLHFERHHSGVPSIDPAQHQLLIHGLVDRPTVFTLDDIKRLPSVSRVHFVECAGNSGSEWGPKTAPDVQRSHGLASCSEWTGVSLKLLLEECGLQKAGKWLVAEGADACKMSRSVPIEKALDDAMIAYGQNGEAIRPEQGYPMRLMLPGFEGNINVKWLRRLKVVDQPAMTKDETSKYTELMPDGKAWIFTLTMDQKSVITYPSGGQKLTGPGFHEIRGLAWSGHGKITRVEVSTDDGKTWRNAQLQEPVLPKAFTRFRMPWKWEGGEVTVLSRSTDESGTVQPMLETLVKERGKNSAYHNNVVKAWKIGADGSVKNVDA